MSSKTPNKQYAWIPSKRYYCFKQNAEIKEKENLAVTLGLKLKCMSNEEAFELLDHHDMQLAHPITTAQAED